MLDTVSVCNAEFTVALDTTASIPVYTFTAVGTDLSKTFNWNIGGSLLRTGRQFDHIFFDAGGWLVTLTVADASDTCSVAQRVNVSLETQAPVESCFFNSWKAEDNSNTYAFETWMPWYFSDMSYSLDFGDGNVTTHDPEFGVPIYHTYSIPGTYQVCQTMNEDSCTYCKEIRVDPFVSPDCDASFTYTIDSTSTENWIYTFTANETDSVKSIFWTFEMQSWATGREVQHIFTDAGNWNVTLWVTSESDTCSTSQIVVPPSPSGCILNVAPMPMFGQNTFDFFVGTEPLAGQLYYTMDFGDGVSISEEQSGGGSIRPFSYRYRRDGTFNVCLTATDSTTFSCEVCEEVEVVLPTCFASFVYHPVDSADQFSYLFTALEISDLYDYRWEIDGQTVSNEELFEFTFIAAGNYEVSLYMTNVSSGDVCKATNIVIIEGTSPICLADFTYQLVDSLNTFHYVFTPLRLDSTATYLWEVEGGFQSSDSVLNYTFSDAGLWNVSLTTFVGNDSSCTAIQTIEVQPGILYIQGTLFADLIPVDRGTVDLYQRQGDEWSPALQTSSQNGAFTFNNLSQGTYIIHARGDEFVNQAFIPTYFVNGVGWQDAYKLDLTGSAEDVKITLIRSQTLSSGQGQVQGRVVSTETEGPFVILLKDRTSRRTVKWTVSDEAHSFSFDQLPFGQYQLTVEKPSRSFSQNVDLTESQSRVSDIELRTDVVLGRNEALSGKLNIYPTMVEDRVFLSNNAPTGGNMTVELRSISGKLLMNQQLVINAGETAELSLPPLKKGIYFIRVVDNEGYSSLTKLIR